MSDGRAEARIVRRYLEAIRASRPRRGRKRTEESIRARLEAIERELATADSLEHLLLVQERINLQKELAAKTANDDIAALEAEFVKIAASYSRRNRVSFDAWRAVGVPAPVLKAAGITK